MSLTGAKMRMGHDLGKFLEEGRKHPEEWVREMLSPCAVPDFMNLDALAICCGAFRRRGIEGVAQLLQEVHRKAKAEQFLDEEESALYYLHGKAWK